MFSGASRFNQPLPILVDTSDVSSCVMNNMFQNDVSFNQNIGNWNVANVTNMASMFFGAYMFNNGEITNTGSNPLNWYVPKCTSFSSMFAGTNNVALAHKFNQPLSILVDTSGVILCTLASMFQNNTSFNQNVGNWNVINVTNMASMFQSASMFNNNASNSIQSWKAPKCITFASMFIGASRFNQPLPDLVDTSNVIDCSLTSMFQNDTSFNQNIGNWNISNVKRMPYMFSGASLFNNGQTGTVTIPNLIITNASYNNTTRVLTCPSGSFLTSGLFVDDVLIIRGTNFIYSSDISTNIVSDTSLVLRRPYGSNISSGNIISIEKQIPGSAPLYWNTSNVTNMGSMFRNAFSFNQYISTDGNIWNTSNVTDASYMFAGTATSGITLFNNGQIISGITAPMGWNLTSANVSNFRTNCRLTNENKPSTISLLQESLPVE